MKIDRGGQITYHGPGQVVVYTLLDLRRRGYGVRDSCGCMEQAVIDCSRKHGVARRGQARTRPASTSTARKSRRSGFACANGCCYHGLALNVDMDLAPFAAHRPCGYPGLTVTQTRDLGLDLSVDSAGRRLTETAATLARLTWSP